jgi:hypothetical protein
MLNSRHRETICARRRLIPSHEEDVPRPAAWLGSSHPVVMGWSRFTPPRGAVAGIESHPKATVCAIAADFMLFPTVSRVQPDVHIASSNCLPRM